METLAGYCFVIDLLLVALHEQCSSLLVNGIQFGGVAEIPVVPRHTEYLQRDCRNGVLCDEARLFVRHL